MAEPRPGADPDAHAGDGEEAPTAPLPSLDVFLHPDPVDRPSRHVRLFGSTTFFRLWLTQVASATGDWLGFLAIAALATRVGAGSPSASVGIVLSARLVPGFFLAPLAGMFADRYDRKRLMVVCDVGRACVLLILPFVDTIPGLVAASLVIEAFTLLWAPAKEASVPHLVPQHHLTTANSLSLVAAYGTMPLAAGIFSLLTKLAGSFDHISFLGFLRADKVGLAFYVDAATFLLEAIIISTLPIPNRRERRKKLDLEEARETIELGGAFHELKEGWKFIFINPTVRAVNLSIATCLIGGGMLVPLGPEFATRVAGAGDAGFGFLIFAMGVGVAIGILVLSILQRNLHKERVFSGAALGCSVCLFLAASMTSLRASAAFVTGLGLCAGAVYVLGFTLLQETVEDDLRGRIFGALYTLVRFCVLLAFAAGPLLAEVLDRLSRRLFDNRHVDLLGVDLFVPGVRLTLWLAAIIIFGAGLVATFSLRGNHSSPSTAPA
jgi:dTMP kinase